MEQYSKGDSYPLIYLVTLAISEFFISLIHEIRFRIQGPCTRLLFLILGLLSVENTMGQESELEEKAELRKEYVDNTVHSDSASANAILGTSNAPNFTLEWVVNGDTLKDDTIHVCLGDLVSRYFINLSEEKDMILRQIVGSIYYEISIAAGDTLIAVTIPVKTRMEGTLTFVSFLDADSNGKLDSTEAQYPGDTLRHVLDIPRPPIFTVQPVDIKACEGDQVVFDFSVKGAIGGEWQIWNESDWAGTQGNDSVLNYDKVDRSMNGLRLRYCAYSQCDTVYSDTVSLSVDTISRDLLPIFTLNPEDTAVFEGEDATFSVIVEKADSISCQVKLSGDSVFREVSGAGRLAGATVSEIYQLNNVDQSLDSLMYRVVAYNCGIAISDTGILQINFLRAGTLTPLTDTCMNVSLDIVASHGDSLILPQGYEVQYLLTKGDSLVILQTNDNPMFTVEDTGTYTIHTLVGELDNTSDPNFLDLAAITNLGETQLNEIVVFAQNNEVRYSLDVLGAALEVSLCDYDELCKDQTFHWKITDPDTNNEKSSTIIPLLYLNGSNVGHTIESQDLLSPFALTESGEFWVRNDTAIVTGIIHSISDTTAKLDMRIVLTSPGSEVNTSTEGKSWLARVSDPGIFSGSGNENWAYWIVDTTSSLTGLGSLTGTFLRLRDSNSDAGKNVIQESNTYPKGEKPRFGGKFLYEGEIIYTGDTSYLNTQGSLSMNIDESDTICGLPVMGPVISHVTAKAIAENEVQINWGTLTEGNGGQIVVERSLDGQLFEQRKIIHGDDLTYNPELHTYIDQRENKSMTYYYRLKIVKPYGVMAYSHMLMVSWDAANEKDYVIFPNPVNDNYLNIQINGPDKGDYFCELYQTDGRICLRKTLDSSNSRINLERLSPGMYIMVITDPSGSLYTKKLSINP